MHVGIKISKHVYLHVIYQWTKSSLLSHKMRLLRYRPMVKSTHMIAFTYQGMFCAILRRKLAQIDSTHIARKYRLLHSYVLSFVTYPEKSGSCFISNVRNEAC